MSYQLEVDIIRLAREMDLLTTPYVFNPSEAERMADAGADLIVAHMGVTTGGSIGAKSSKTLDDCVTRIRTIADAARGVNPDVLVICHGGPISEPPDAEYIITNCRGVDGFYGASSVERLPAERAIAEQIRTFKRIRPCRQGRQRGQGDDEPRAAKPLRFVTAKTARSRARPVGQALVAVASPADRHEAADAGARHHASRHRAIGFHYHPTREEIIYIVDGVAEQWVDREKRTLKAGECAFIPKKVVHAIHNVVEEADDLPGDPVAGGGEGPFLVDCYDDEPWRSLRPPAPGPAPPPRGRGAPRGGAPQRGSRPGPTPPILSRLLPPTLRGGGEHTSSGGGGGAAGGGGPSTGPIIGGGFPPRGRLGRK